MLLLDILNIYRVPFYKDAAKLGKYMLEGLIPAERAHPAVEISPPLVKCPVKITSGISNVFQTNSLKCWQHSACFTSHTEHVFEPSAPVGLESKTSCPSCDPTGFGRLAATSRAAATAGARRRRAR